MNNQNKQKEYVQEKGFIKIGFLLIFFCLFSMLPFCRAASIKLVEILLHKNLNHEFWNQIILYVLVTISSFLFYSLLSSFFSYYSKSDKFNLKRTMILISIILFIISLVVQTVVLYNGIVYGLDDPAYVAIAKEMAENTYKTDYIRMQNIRLQFAIGYPSLIAGVIKIFGMNFYAIKFVNVLLYAIFVVILFNFLFFLIKDIQISLFISSLFCLNFTISNWQNHTMSDTPCMVFSLFCLALIYNIYFSKSQKKFIKAILLGCCLFIAYECRMNGLICILTFFSIQLIICLSKLLSNSKLLQTVTNDYFKTNYKIHLIPYVVFIILLCIQKIVYPTLPRQDLFFLSDLSIKSCFSHFCYFNFMYRFFNSAWNDVFHQFNLLSKVAFYLSLLFAFYGLIKNWKKLFIFLPFTLGNIAIYCLWKGFGDFRFYLPLYISLAVFCAYGAKSIKECFHGKDVILPTIMGKAFVLMFCAMFTVSVFPVYTKTFKDEIKKNGHSYSFEAQDIWAYINKNISEDKTFIFRSPIELYLYTKHNIAEPESADYYLHNFEISVDWDRKNMFSDETVFGNLIEISGRQFELEYSNDKFRLFHAK